MPVAGPVSVERLQKRGYTVVAPPNPLRGVSEDSAYIKSRARRDPPDRSCSSGTPTGAWSSPKVGDPDVKALVYIAAFAPDKGHTVLSLSGLAPGGELGPALAFRDVPVPGGQEGYITPSAFREVFAADVDRSTAAVMAASQRPAAVAALGEPSPNEPAWRTIPSWYMVATQDRAIGAAPERIMAKRIGAKTVEVRSSHVPMITHPREVTELILAATRSGH